MNQSSLLNPPVVSIIICTRDRASDLAGTLEAIGRTCVPEGMPCELVVVDNASADGTARLVQECRLPNMPVRWVGEPRQGKGYAYNAGLAAAQGQVFLFTDDDVRPPADWVAGMAGPILSGAADAVAGGVRLAPHLHRPWMDHIYRGLLAASDGIHPDHPWAMIGANMAFGRHVLERVPAFDTELGPGALGFFDESLFSFQLKRAGYRLIAALEVAVEHHLDPARITREHFLNTARKYGRSLAYVDYHWEHRTQKVVPARLWVRRLRLGALRVLRARDRRHAEYAPHWELHHVQNVAFFRQFLRERVRSRNYDKQGLVKRGGSPPREHESAQVPSQKVSQQKGSTERVVNASHHAPAREGAAPGQGEIMTDAIFTPGGEGGPPPLSVVIPTCRRNDLLARCLDRLAPGAQTLPSERYEVIVTDDGTDDQNARTMLAERYPWARWTAGPRRGPAANRNHGASLAASPWIAFTDDDCLPVPGWLKSYADAITPGASVYEGKTTCEGRQPTPLEYSPINLYGGQLWSCNMMIAKDTLAAIGGFDENYPHAHMEDTDLRERLKAGGYAFPFVPAAVIDHPPRPRHWRSLAASQECETVYWFKQGNTRPFAGRLLWQFTKYRLSIIKRWILAEGVTRDVARAAALMPVEVGYVAWRVNAWDRKYRRKYAAAGTPRKATAP